MGPGEFLNINFFTALFTLVNTIVLFLVMKKFLFKPVQSILEKRNSEIEDGYIKAQAAADKADADYVVVAGDTVSKIAIRYGLDWKELAQYNKLANPNLIYVGQTLKIPQ